MAETYHSINNHIGIRPLNLNLNIMQTEFTCGIYTASFNKIGGNKWFLKVSQHTLGIIEEDGTLVMFTEPPKYFSSKDFAEITDVMNNIKRQYKQIQAT